MNLKSGQSNINADLIKKQSLSLSILRAEIESYLKNENNQSKINLTKAFFKSVFDVLIDKGSTIGFSGDFCVIEREDISRLASRHLYHWTRDINKGIIYLNEAISHLNTTGIIAIPIIDASKIFLKNIRRQAFKLDHLRWQSYLKVENLYDFFVHHFEVQNNEEELSCAAVFSIIVNGCHFHNSYLSILDMSISDFNPTHLWILLQKKYMKKRNPSKVKIRFFLSAISVISLLRLMKLTSYKINSLNDKLFQQSFLLKNRTGYDFSKKFKSWLDRLVGAFNEHKNKQENHGLSEDVVIRSITIRELYFGSQIWTGLRYPFFVTSYLSQKVVPGQLSSVNYSAFFSNESILYATKLSGSTERRSWLSAPASNSSDPNKRISDDSYIKLMNIHSAITRHVEDIQGNSGKKEKIQLVSEIKRLTELLPHPSSTLSREENGYLSNYKLLTEWFAVILLTRKVKIKTAFDYFSNLANIFFFAFADTSIISLDKYELSDVIFEIIHSYSSPRTQRTIKNKMKQFFIFINSQYPFHNVDWNNPDFWIFDEPVEREIMGFSEFDKVFEEMGSLADSSFVDMLRAVMILLFYAGLRIHEAARLSHDAVYIDSELNIFIRKSKTIAGKRTLPLHYLIPDKELRFLRDFIVRRRPKGSKKGIYLFSLDGVSCPEPDVLANMITSVIFKCLGRYITCHQLRHSFASWFMLRWYALLYGTKTMDLFFIDRTNTVFSKTELQKLRTLFLGYGKERLGDKYFMHAIIVISRLLGHAGPETTVTVYTHTIDILYKLFVAEKDETSFFSVPRAAKILGVSYPTAKKLTAKNNMINLPSMLKYCLLSYDLPSLKV